MFDWLNSGLGYIIKFCYSLTNNYALALLLFAFLIKVLLFPLGIKQQKNMVKQAKLRPREMGKYYFTSSFDFLFNAFFSLMPARMGASLSCNALRGS